VIDLILTVDWPITISSSDPRTARHMWIGRSSVFIAAQYSLGPSGPAKIGSPMFFSRTDHEWQR
jgi:hypothetical protein